jgi:hypothetical protein
MVFHNLKTTTLLELKDIVRKSHCDNFTVRNIDGTFDTNNPKAHLLATGLADLKARATLGRGPESLNAPCE